MHGTKYARYKRCTVQKMHGTKDARHKRCTAQKMHGTKDAGYKRCTAQKMHGTKDTRYKKLKIYHTLFITFQFSTFEHSTRYCLCKNIYKSLPFGYQKISLRSDFGLINEGPLKYRFCKYFFVLFCCGAATQRGSWPPHS